MIRKKLFKDDNKTQTNFLSYKNNVIDVTGHGEFDTVLKVDINEKRSAYISETTSISLF